MTFLNMYWSKNRSRNRFRVRLHEVVLNLPSCFTSSISSTTCSYKCKTNSLCQIVFNFMVIVLMAAHNYFQFELQHKVVLSNSSSKLVKTTSSLPTRVRFVEHDCSYRLGFCDGVGAWLVSHYCKWAQARNIQSTPQTQTRFQSDLKVVFTKKWTLLHFRSRNGSKKTLISNSISTWKTLLTLVLLQT